MAQEVPECVPGGEPLRGGEGDRHSDDEQERGENKVRERHAVRIFRRMIKPGRHALHIFQRINENHGEDRQSPESVDCKHAPQGQPKRQQQSCTFGVCHKRHRTHENSTENETPELLCAAPSVKERGEW